MRLVFQNVAHLELDVDGDARVQVVECRPQADESEAVAPSSPAFDFAAAGRHSWHVRRGRSDPTCTRCMAMQSLQSHPRATLEPPSGAPPSDQIESKSDFEFDQERTGRLIDLPREDVAALRTRWSRGGRSNREPFLAAEGLARLDRIAACADHSQAYSAAVIQQAPRGVNLLTHLERSHTELHRPPPPDPSLLVEAAAREAERRRESYREQLERGTDEAGRPLSDLGRAVLERSLARDRPQADQPRGP